MQEHKLPPQNLEAEQSVLGGVLIDNNSMLVVSDILLSQAFYRSSHQKIYEGMLYLSQKREPIDLITLTDYLKQKDILEEVGGVPYIAYLVDSVPTAANIKNYARIVKEKAILRAIITAASEMVTSAYDSENVAEILDEAQRRILSLSLTQDSPIKDMRSVMKEVCESIEALANNTSHLIGVPSGFERIDNIFCGFRPGELIVLAGRPRMGKSALAKCIAESAGFQKMPVLYSSIEMAALQCGKRHLAGIGKLESNKIRSGKLTGNDWQRLSGAAGKLSELPIYFDDSGFQTDATIMTRARRLKAEKGLRLVIVDYLQLVRCSEKKYTREAEVATISGNLKAMAKDLQVPVICLAQLNRACENEKRRPMLSDLRESGAIEQDADIVAFVHREHEYDYSKPKEEGEFIVAKNRDGETGIVKLTWKGEYTHFVDPENPFWEME